MSLAERGTEPQLGELKELLPMKSTARRGLLLTLAASSLYALVAHAQAPAGPTRLTTEFRGAGMCLDVVNGGPTNHQAHLDTCQNVSGQSWIFEPAAGGMYRIHTEFTGPQRCLDINPSDNRAEFRPCGNFTGQLWRLTPGDNGTARLSTQFRGPGMCLDVVNGGPRNNFVELRPCGNFSGQLWHSNP